MWTSGVSLHTGPVLDPVCVEGTWYQAFSTSCVCSTFSDIGLGSDSVCARPSSHRIKSFDSLGSQSSHSRTSKLLQSQYRSLVSKMFYFLIQRHFGHKGLQKCLGGSVSPCRRDVGHLGLLALLGGSCCVWWHVLFTGLHRY